MFSIYNIFYIARTMDSMRIKEKDSFSDLFFKSKRNCKAFVRTLDLNSIKVIFIPRFKISTKKLGNSLLKRKNSNENINLIYSRGLFVDLTPKVIYTPPAKEIISVAYKRYSPNST